MTLRSFNQTNNRNDTKFPISDTWHRSTEGPASIWVSSTLVHGQARVNKTPASEAVVTGAEFRAFTLYPKPVARVTEM